jgi:hypothetical protein
MNAVGAGYANSPKNTTDTVTHYAAAPTILVLTSLHFAILHANAHYLLRGPAYGKGRPACTERPPVFLARRAQSVQETQPCTSVPSSAVWRRRM